MNSLVIGCLLSPVSCLLILQCSQARHQYPAPAMAAMAARCGFDRQAAIFRGRALRMSPHPKPSLCPRHNFLQEWFLRMCDNQRDDLRLLQPDDDLLSLLGILWVLPTISERLPFPGGSRNGAEWQHAFAPRKSGDPCAVAQASLSVRLCG